MRINDNHHIRYTIQLLSMAHMIPCFAKSISYAKSSTSEYNAKPERQRTNLADDACFGAHTTQIYPTYWRFSNRFSSTAQFELSSQLLVPCLPCWCLAGSGQAGSILPSWPHHSDFCSLCGAKFVMQRIHSGCKHSDVSWRQGFQTQNGHWMLVCQTLSLKSSTKMLPIREKLGLRWPTEVLLECKQTLSVTCKPMAKYHSLHCTRQGIHVTWC